MVQFKFSVYDFDYFRACLDNQNGYGVHEEV